VSPLVLALLCAAPASGWAHAILLESRPPAGGAAEAGRLDIRLRFNSRLDHDRSRLVLVAPDGGQSVLTLDPADAPDVLGGVAALTPGAYVLRWTVLAVDGHITRGDVPFTVNPPPARR
jgi:methionine-rich copper-binding protein CopC